MKKKFWKMVAEWRLTRAKKKGEKALDEFVKFVQAYRKEDPENDSEIRNFAQEIADYIVKVSDAAWENPNVMYELQEHLPSGRDYTKEECKNDIQELVDILVNTFNEATGMELNVVLK